MSNIINIQLLQLENWRELKLENKAHYHYNKYGLQYKIAKVNTESIIIIAKQVKLIGDKPLEAERIISLCDSFFNLNFWRGLAIIIHARIYKQEPKHA